MRLPTGLGDPADLALFLDFDGTLVEIAERPDAVRLSEATRWALESLYTATGGAVAIVTGRDIDSIDHFLAPLHLPAAGVHGLTRRDALGALKMPAVDTRFFDAAEALLAPLLASAPGLIAERKTAAIALHYRLAPQHEHACLDAMQRLADLAPGLAVTRNKMVFEVRPAGIHKGSAIAAFMAEPPFAGRRPVFAGDDVTDEDAFAVVNDLGGLTIKVGPGATIARWRADDSAAFVAWLLEVARGAVARGGTATPRGTATEEAS